jgi:uridylate kinase
MSKEKPAYNRILLKLSGESLLGDLPFGIDIKTANSIAQDIKEIHDLNVQIAIMIGGGNLFRGIRGTEEGMDRASADYMGLMATIMNAIALQDALEKVGCDSRHICAIEVKAVAEPFIRGRVIRHLEKGRVVIFSADPVKDKSAKKFMVISHEDVIKRGLQVMDTTAFTLCKENKMPIVIFNLQKQGNLKNAVLGLDVGTKIF